MSAAVGLGVPSGGTVNAGTVVRWRPDRGAPVAVGPGRATGAFLASQESRAPACQQAPDVRMGEPARFPARRAARAAETTCPDLYIELI